MISPFSLMTQKSLSCFWVSLRIWFLMDSTVLSWSPDRLKNSLHKLPNSVGKWTAVLITDSSYVKNQTLAKLKKWGDIQDMKRREINRLVNVAILLDRRNRRVPCIGCHCPRMVIRYRTIERFETVCCRKRVYPDAMTLIKLLPVTRK